MLTTTTPTRSRTTLPHPHLATAPRVTALCVAVDEAHAHLNAALADLRALVCQERLGAEDAAALEAEYIERYLHRVAALEERGALGCTPEEWQRFTAVAVRRTAARRGAVARREHERDRRTARDCLVVAPGRIVDRSLSAPRRCRARRGDPRDPRRARRRAAAVTPGWHRRRRTGRWPARQSSAITARSASAVTDRQCAKSSEKIARSVISAKLTAMTAP